MKKFIYVFSEADRDRLLRAGYVLMKEDVQNATYVFCSDNRLSYALEDISCVFSDTLSF